MEQGVRRISVDGTLHPLGTRYEQDRRGKWEIVADPPPLASATSGVSVRHSYGRVVSDRGGS